MLSTYSSIVVANKVTEDRVSTLIIGPKFTNTNHASAYARVMCVCVFAYALFAKSLGPLICEYNMFLVQEIDV